MSKFLQQLISSAVLFAGILYFMGYFDEPDTTYQRIESASPDKEQSFVGVVRGYIKKSNDAKNDLQIAALKTERNRKICQVLNGNYSVNNWVGKVNKLGSSGDGKGVVNIEIAKRVVIKTWNNDFSDGGSNTLIDQNTALFQRALNLNVGDLVKFSGSFFRDKNECIRETSLTQNGGMTEPEFVFKFSDISKL